MYKNMLVLLAIATIILGIVQPAAAAQYQSPQKAGSAQEAIHKNVQADMQLFNHTATDLRLQRAKTAASGGIDSAIRALEAAKGRVDRSKLTDGQNADLQAQIEANITWFEAKKSDVQASQDTASVWQNARQAADRWKEVDSGLKKEMGLMACDNLGQTLNSARNASAIASGKIESLKKQGKDTSSLEKALASYNGHIDTAAGHLASARTEFGSISAPDDGHFAAGLRQIGSAQNEMKSAYADLKAIYRLVYGNGVSAA